MILCKWQSVTCAECAIEMGNRSLGRRWGGGGLCGEGYVPMKTLQPILAVTRLHTRSESPGFEPATFCVLVGVRFHRRIGKWMSFNGYLDSKF
jgi:hypothetical protein